jgi:hypothetical protein
MARRYTREDAARDRFLRESTGVGSESPWSMTPGEYTSDDLDRIAASLDRARYAPDPLTPEHCADCADAFERFAAEDADLSDMADWRKDGAR